jgi:hypothetical protein
MTDINATLFIGFSTDGFTALQPTSPQQYFTPATGQRAYTVQDALGALNDAIYSNTDPTSTGGDTPDVLYNFVTSSDGMILIDNAFTAFETDELIYDDEFTYAQGAWQ